MRLIDADALTMLAYKSGDYGHPAVVDLEDIADAPTIDAVPVVRCKDCKQCKAWKNSFSGFSGFRCESICADIKPDDFCSYGERKDGEG